MSYIRAKSNPFFESNHLTQTDLTMPDSGLMPRTYPDFPSNLTPFHGQKRRLEDELLTTPERSTTSTDSLITPPRTNKKPKTAPSSPLSEHNQIYETPQTPTNRQDYNISLKLNLSPNYRYSFTSPENYATNSSSSLSSSNEANDAEKIDIELPKVSLPQVKLKNNKHSGNMYNFPDTCYPYTLPGSVLTKDNGLRLSTWRQTCDSMVRHGYSDELKLYRKYSEELTASAQKRIKSTELKVPSLSNTELFPNINATNNYVKKLVEYPKVNATREFSSNIEEEAKALLEFRKRSSERKASIPLQQTQITLPPCSEILNPAYFDKSTIHASGLTSLEYHQFHNPNVLSIDFQTNPKTFHNGKQVKTGQEYTYVDPLKKLRTQPETQNNYRSDIIPISYGIPQSSRIAYYPTNITHYNAKNTNPYYDLSQQIADDACIQPHPEAVDSTQTCEVQPLNIKKTRSRSSVSKLSKSLDKTRTKNAKSVPLSTTSSRGSSRRSSRRSSVGSHSDTTTVGTPSMRTRSGNSSRKASNETIMTAEVPASVKNSPTRTRIDVPKVNSSQETHNFHLLGLRSDCCFDNESNSIKLPPLQNMTQYRSPPQKSEILNFSLKNTQQPQYSKNIPSDSEPYGSDYNTQSHYNSILNMSEAKKITDKDFYSSKTVKTCMSCKSVSSPCWRPSWSPDEGQLCNSCGLRYRKTKARCYNPQCLKIPSKSEWNLMVKRGKILLDVYDNLGRPNGQEMCYRCLDCDSAMQLLR